MNNRTRWSLSAILLVCLLALGVGSRARAQSPNRVGLVVQYGDGSVITHCVEFSEPEISGYDVLTRAGLDVVSNFDSGIGAGICSLDGEGCPADDCFCQCEGEPCIYWAYYHLVDGQWLYSNLGAGSHNVQNGDVEGWHWGEAAPPPVIAFDQICAPPATNTPVPTATPVPPTATPTPAPPEVWFRLDENPIAAGACTYVRWDTARAQEVYLDGEPVSAIGSLEVCPTEPQTYLLRVVGAQGETTHELVLGVTGEIPDTATPTSPAPTPAPSSPTPGSEQPIPSPSPDASPTSTPVPTESDPTVPPTSSPSPTIAPTQITPSSTPIPVAEVDSTPAATDMPATSDGEPSTSRSISVGYIAFGLIAVALVGWLVFETQRRKR